MNVGLPLLLGLHLASGASAEPPELYAIIVGYNGGRSGGDEAPLPALRFADDDALKFYRWFNGLAPQEHLWLLAEPDDDTRAAWGDGAPAGNAPTRTALLQAIEQLKAKVRGRPARVYFIYAGHGLPGRFLLKPEASDEAAFTGRELRAAFADLEAQTAVLFLDACRSQSLFAERGSSDFSQEVKALERSTENTRLGILTATSSSQSAGEATSLSGGYFSHVLASGLAGAADADADGTIRFGELAAFVAFHTERLFGQRPWFEAPGGDLRAAVIELKGRTGLTLSPRVAGRLKVRALPDRRVVVELNKPPGLPIRLALPEGSYLLERATDAAEVSVGSSESAAVEPDAFVSRAVAQRGADELDGFQSPFSSDVVSALSAGYQSGVQISRVAAWTDAVDASYGLNLAPFGVLTLEHGAEVGYRHAFHRWFFAGLRALFHQTSVSQVTLSRAGAFLNGGARISVGSFEIQPHLGLGLTPVWRTERGTTRADFWAPLMLLALRGEIPLSGGFAISVEARGELTFLALDRVRTPFLSPLLSLGVSWKR